MAETYYVAIDGNDSWPGTEQQPFRTIQRGVNAVVAGDTLLIKNGTYVEEVDVSRSGTASAPITIKAYPDHKPVIDGRAGVDGINSGLPTGDIAETNPITGAGAKYTGLFDVTGSYVIVEGLEIKRSMGRGMRVYSISGGKVEYVTLRNLVVTECREAVVLFWGSNDGTDLSISNVTVEGCDLSYGGTFYEGKRNPAIASWPGCLSFRSVKYGVVRNCVIHEHWGEKILLDANDGGSHHFIVEDNVFYDCKNSCYLHAVSDVVFQRNFLYRSSTDRDRDIPFGPSIGIAVSPAESTTYKPIPTKNIKILNNIIVGDGAGVDVRSVLVDLPLSNIFIAHNTIVNNTNVGVAATVRNKENMTFRNNIVYSDIGSPLVYDNGQTSTGWTYSNNMYSSRPSALNDPNDVIGDPQFRNAVGFPAAGEGDPVDYQILPGSGAIDAGFQLDEPRDDFFRNLRIGVPDIGGHEEGASGFIQADFEATPLSGVAPLTVTFQDTSSSTAAITEWLWEFGDGTISGQQNPTHVFNSGTFTVSLKVTSSAGSDTVTKTDFITVSPAGTPPPPRVTDGLQALYLFNEGSGRTIYDVSEQGNALDLQIKDLTAVNWREEGLTILSPTLIASTSPAEKIFQACIASNEITLEAWLKPANTTQAGPARIISISQNTHSRNITLGQGLWGSLPSDVYDVRLRTTERSANGLPSFSSPAGSLTAEKTHFVYTRNNTGAARIFLNGILIAETIVSGDFATWNPRFPLLLANETTGDYPWLGDYYLVAIYERALGTPEVQQNYDAGLTSKVGAAELPVLLPIFKRFYIADSNGTLVLGNEKEYPTFGVQYPDLRCVTCRSNGDQTLTVHDSIEATLRSYGATTADLHWLD